MYAAVPGFPSPPLRSAIDAGAEVLLAERRPLNDPLAAIRPATRQDNPWSDPSRAPGDLTRRLGRPLHIR